jgi:YVTN family beta-propeller protein
VFIAELGNNTLGVVDVENKKVVGRITGLKEPQGVAYAPTADLFYVANGGDGSVNRFRGGDLSPAGTIKFSGDAPTLAAFDIRTGSVTRLPTCGDADDVFVDAKRHHLYVSCGEGAVAVIEARGDGYAELGRVRTISGARTALFVPELDRLFLAVRASGNEPAALWVMRPLQS